MSSLNYCNYSSNNFTSLAKKQERVNLQESLNLKDESCVWKKIKKNFYLKYFY